MKYIIPCLLILIGLTQCTKDSPNPPDTTINDIFNVTPNPDYLLDSITVSTTRTKETRYGYFFLYDHLNRVSMIRSYEYFYNIPLNNTGNWTFNYQGSSNRPESMDQQSYNNYRVYFFYNANGSKNRDSLVSSSPSSWAVRKYEYDSAFNFAVARHYYNGSLKPSLQDSATFKNYNCNGIYSNQITWSGVTPYSYEWFTNTYPQVDNKPNPFSKLNIFPALFLSPYLHLGYKISGDMWRGSIVMDFAFRYNPEKYRFHDYASGGYTYTYIQSGEGETYDAKNRIVRKDFADSTGNAISVQYSDRFYATYTYR